MIDLTKSPSSLDGTVRQKDVTEFLTPILASIPEDWVVYYGWHDSATRLCNIPNYRPYIQTRVYLWYSAALEHRANGDPWEDRSIIWVGAFPPGSALEKTDDLGYLNCALIADIKKTYETGELS